MLTETDIIISTIAGFIYSGVYLKYDSIPIKTKYLLIIIATILDWYPVIFSTMIDRITFMVFLHFVTVVCAYSSLLIWFFDSKKSIYDSFYLLWFIAYIIGWICYI